MKELVELRVSPGIKKYLPEEYMAIAKCVGSISIVDTCVFELLSNDNRWSKIIEACECLELEKRKQHLNRKFSEFDKLAETLSKNAVERGWQVHASHGYSYVCTKRKYTKKELNTAKVLQIIPYVVTQFTRKNEDLDCIYDIDSRCKMCGILKQKSELIFESIKLPKTKDIISVFGYNETIVSEKIVNLIEKNNIKGVELKDVYVRNRSKLSKIDGWKQLSVDLNVKISKKTIFGYDYFHPDKTCSENCKVCGLTIGQGIQSELYVDGGTWNNYDISFTKERIGGGTSLGIPLQLIIASHKFYKLMKENDIKGFHVEVAHID